TFLFTSPGLGDCQDWPACGVYKYRQFQDVDVTHCLTSDPNVQPCVKDQLHPCVCDGCEDRQNDNFHCNECGCIYWCDS
ncbi:190_t:CDS:2, partial [Dentiscutata erythropus]